MKKHIVLGSFLFLLLLVQLTVFAQNDEDKMIFKAMNDELQRNFKELQLAGERPCFIEYVVKTSKVYELNGTLGTITTKIDSSVSNKIATRLMLGNYELNSDIYYQPFLQSAPMIEELNYNVLRRGFWLLTDRRCKDELKNFNQKRTYLKERPRTEEENKLLDFTRLPEAHSTIIESPKQDVDMGQWEKNIMELSAIFKNYPKLFKTSVRMTLLEQVFHKTTSEGTMLRLPYVYVSVSAKASIRTKEDCVLVDEYSVIVPLLAQLPDLSELKEQITAFADKFSQYNQTVLMEEPYVGPVLFEDQAIRETFRFNTVESWALLSNRGTKHASWYGRMNQQVINSKLSVLHYGNMKNYQGKEVYGGYEIDAEGMKPVNGLTLIDEGVFKNRLCTRIPDAESAQSTGSCRFKLSIKNVDQGVAPGIVHVTATGTTKAAKMKRALMKLAKKEGLEYAYIFRETGGVKGTPYIYRVDVNTGEEVLMSNAKLKYTVRLEDSNVLAISDEERVDNYFWSNGFFSTMIHPRSVLLKDIRIEVEPVRARAKDVVDVNAI